MDFRRIEIIFLIVFVSLDVFLLLSFRNSQQIVTSSATNTSTISEMRKRDISLGKIDSKSGSAYYLGARSNTALASNVSKLREQEVQYDETDHKLTSELSAPFAVTKENRVKKINKFIEKESNVLFGTHYKYSPQLSSSSQIVYVETANYLGEIYDKTAQLTFNVSGGRVDSYTQTYIKDLMILHEKEATKSEKDIIINLYTNSEIPNNSKVLYSNLAYTKLLDAKGSTIYIPVWFVTVQNRDSKVTSLKKVNAFTGNIIKSSTTGDDYSE